MKQQHKSRPKAVIASMATIAIATLGANISSGQTSMKVGNDSGTKFTGRIHCYFANETPQAAISNRIKVGSAQQLRVVANGNWQVRSPGVVDFCVDVGVRNRVNNAAVSGPITLTISDRRAGLIEMPAKAPATNHTPLAPVIRMLAGPIAAGATVMAPPSYCVTNLPWNKRPQLWVSIDTVENPQSPDAVCRIDFADKAAVNPVNKGNAIPKPQPKN